MTASEFNRCVDAYSDNVYRFILKNLGDSDKSRDIVQDSFEKMWIKHLEIEVLKAKSYLFTTAYHTMIDNIRKDKRMEPSTKIKAEKYVVDEQYSGLQEILADAVKKLPEDQRSVIMLRDYEGYTYEEIAEITGLNLAQVKVYIYRGRMFLKNYIGSMETVI